MVPYLSSNRGTWKNKSISNLVVSVAFDDFLVGSDSLGHLGVLFEVLPRLGEGLRPGVEGFGFDLALGFQGSDNILVFPSDLVTKATQTAELEILKRKLDNKNPSLRYLK